MPDQNGDLTGSEKFATWTALIGTAGCALWIIVPVAFFILVVILSALGE